MKGDLEALLSPGIAQFEVATHPALHPGRCARILLEGQPVGHVGELHPQWRLAYELPAAPILFELDLEAVLDCSIPSFRTLPRQQAVVRDLAVVVGAGVHHDDLMRCVRAADESSLLKDLHPVRHLPPCATGGDFAEGERSLAIRLQLQTDEAPLTDEQADALTARVLMALQQQLKARLRGLKCDP